MTIQTLVKKCLPQNPDIEVLLPNYKEPILAVNHGGKGWYGLMAYNEKGQLMCHECGEFKDSLGLHILKHGLSNSEYKIKYGLLQRSKLVSEHTSRKYRLASLANPAWIKQTQETQRKIRDGIIPLSALSALGHKGRTKKIALEFQNKHDSCPAQLLRLLSTLAQKHGPAITYNEIQKDKPGLCHLLERRFGSLNKAKQMVRLAVNGQHLQRGQDVKYDNQLLLEDMVCFHMVHGHWPETKDYYSGLMICRSTWPLSRNGGIRALRQEAMKLRKEQEDRRIRGEGITQRANDIELECAGYARK